VTRPPFLRCQRDQAGVLDPVTSAYRELSASWNVAPTNALPVIRLDKKAGERSLDLPRWGLVIGRDDLLARERARRQRQE
jgi:putative SOS response-associated peptidase YedK